MALLIFFPFYSRDGGGWADCFVSSRSREIDPLFQVGHLHGVHLFEAVHLQLLLSQQLRHLVCDSDFRCCRG